MGDIETFGEAAENRPEYVEIGESDGSSRLTLLVRVSESSDIKVCSSLSSRLRSANEAALCLPSFV